MLPSPDEERVSVFAPISAPVGIASAQRQFESADIDRFDLAQHAADHLPACSELISHEIGMSIMEPVEQSQEEVGRVGQILHIDRHDREPAFWDGRASDP